MQARKLTASFEGLNSSLAQSSGELNGVAKTCPIMANCTFKGKIQPAAKGVKDIFSIKLVSYAKMAYQYKALLQFKKAIAEANKHANIRITLQNDK